MNPDELFPDFQDRLRHMLGAGAEIHRTRRLTGATSSTLYAVDATANGRQRSLVLRLFTNPAWLAEEPDVPLHEAANLARLRGTGLPVPELVALDAGGNGFGVPALLMSRLPGRVNLTPSDFDGWLRRLAAFLPRLHAVPPGDHAWRYQPYNRPAELAVPDWSSHPERWEKAIRIGQGPFPPFSSCLIHRDYHPVNVLFQGGTISGVVDWPNACVGPAGFDVAHCRINLAHMYGLAAADRFLDLCTETMGAYWRYDPFWDLVSILDWLPATPDVYPGWITFGLQGLTPALVMERYEAYLASILARF